MEKFSTNRSPYYKHQKRKSMNKLINMNLGGMPFQIDDEAYSILNAYLSAVKRKFNDQEIVEDIEARLAEMFHDNLKATGKQIVSTTNVNEAIEVMGKPEEFEQGYAESDYTDSYENATGYSKRARKLFRDPDDKVFGGVVSGLTKYFGIDSPTWFRVGLFILPFLDWMGLYISTSLVLLTYIVMWIVVPKAKTATQKMQMRGEPINLDNIERSFNDGFDTVKKNLNRERTSQMGNGIESFIKAVLKVLLFIGLGIAILFTLCIVAGLIATAFGVGLTSPTINQYLTGSALTTWSAVIGIIFMCLAPAVFLITLLIKLLFKHSIKMPMILAGTLSAFILGFVLSVLSVGNVIADFNKIAKVKESSTLFTEPQELFIYGNELTDLSKKISFTAFNDEHSINENVDLRIRESLGNETTLTISKKARGKNHKLAKERLKSLDYSFQITGNQLNFDEFFTIDKNDLFRDQEVDITLKIPTNTVLNFDESAYGVVKNATINGEYYSDYRLSKGKRWKFIGTELAKIDNQGNILKATNDSEKETTSTLEEIIENEFDIDNLNIDFDFDENENHLEVEVFGKDILTIDVLERNENNEPKRINVQFGNKKLSNLEINED